MLKLISNSVCLSVLLYGVANSQESIPGADIDVQAGIPDPKDQSHITFAFVCGPRWAEQLPATTGTIDAYLKNDDSIEFSGHSSDGSEFKWVRAKISGVIAKEYLHNGVAFLTGRD